MENAVIQRLKIVVEQKRLSVTALGKLIGVHPSTLNRQFNGESAMTLSTIDAFLQYFGDVSAEWLLRGEGNMFKSQANCIEDETLQKISGEFEIDENGYLKVKLLK